MRVLLSAYSCEPGRGSEAGFGWTWARSLAEKGARVVVLTSHEGRPAIERQLAEDPVPGLQVVFVAPPASVTRLARGQLGVYADYLAWQQRAYSTARALVRERAFDIVHHVTWGSLQLGSPMGRLGLPFVLGPIGGGQTARSALRQFHVGKRSTEDVRTLVTRWLLPLDVMARSAVRSAALTLVVNADTGHAARRLGARAVEYLNDAGLDPARMRAEPPSAADLQPGPLRLLWIARLLPRKGLPLALHALATVPRSADVHLTVVGDGPQAARVPAWISELDLSSRVTYLGQQSWDEVERHYLDSEVLLFTSLRESVGAQLLEAMSYGLAIVTLDQHGARDLVPVDAGIKVGVRSAEQVIAELAAGITALARDPDRRLAMRRAAWSFAQSQSWPDRADAMVQRYRAIVGLGQESPLGR